jgi:hypothetical protein
LAKSTSYEAPHLADGKRLLFETGEAERSDWRKNARKTFYAAYVVLFRPKPWVLEQTELVIQVKKQEMCTTFWK